MIPVSRCPAPPGPVGPVIAGPSEAALPLLLSSGLFGRRRGCEPVSDALCRDSHEENHPIRLHDPSRQRRAASSDQSAFHRRRSPLPPAIPETRLREACSSEDPRQLPPTSAFDVRSASTTSNRPNPGSPFTPVKGRVRFGGCPRGSP